jgi:undecaprenyl-diphosphatase
MESIILGSIQGLTEFLPVSSSGHLALFAGFMNESDEDLLYEVLLHLGTLLSVIIVFRQRLKELIVGLFKKDKASIQYAFYVFVSCVPTGIIGILFEDKVSKLSGAPLVVSALLFLTGLALFSTKFTGEPKELPEGDLGLNPLKAFVLGLAQSIAILPGISRSGSTIVTALWLKVPRQVAGEFSFLMSIPVIGGAALLKIKDAIETGAFEQTLNWAPLSGVAVSFLSGLFALKFLLVFVKKGSFYHFSWYVFAMAIFGLFYFS